MSKNHLTLADLKEQGFKLSKDEANELAPFIRHAAHHGSDEEIIFEGTGSASQNEDAPKKPAKDKPKKVAEPQDEETEAGKPDDNEQTGDISDTADSGKPAFSLPVPGEHHATKKKRLKDTGMIEHVVSEDDLANNPELGEAGVKVGDTIEISADQD